MSDDNRTALIKVRVTPATQARFAARCKEHDTTVSAAMREALAEWIRNHPPKETP